MSEYFPKPKYLGTSVKDLSNYGTKTDLKHATFAKNFANKTGLLNLKSDVDKLDIDKLKNVPSGLNSFKSKIDKLDIGNQKLLQMI